MIERKTEYKIGVDMAKEGTESMIIYTNVDPIREATSAILNDLDDIDKNAVAMWEDNPENVVRIKTMTKAMRVEIEQMIYDSIPER
jgi:hypothetical protein